MGQKLKRVKRVSHLYERKYQTATGETRTKFYGIFTCKLRGKRRVLALGGNLQDAKDELARRLADNVVGKDFDDDNSDRVQGMTLFPWCERFLQVKAWKRSLDKDIGNLELLKSFFGDCPLGSITTSMIEAYKQTRLGQKTRRGKAPAPATINRELSLLSTMLILAAHDRLIEHVPYIELFEENNERDRTASEDEIRSLFEAAPEHLREILMCLWDTGMRKREALYLTWDRVDFANELIYLGVKDSKGKYQRSVPISPRLKDVLLAIRQREKRGKVARMTDRVFLFRGKPIDRCDTAFKNACERAGIKRGMENGGLVIHDIRASFATRKVAAGYDRDWIKRITGHKTDNVFKRYNRPSVDQLKRVVSEDKLLYADYTGDGTPKSESA